MSVHTIARAHQFLQRFQLLFAGFSRALELRAGIWIPGLFHLLLEMPDLRAHRLWIHGTQISSQVLTAADQPSGESLELRQRAEGQRKVAIDLLGVARERLIELFLGGQELLECLLAGGIAQRRRVGTLLRLRRFAFDRPAPVFAADEVPSYQREVGDSANREHWQ